MVQANSQSIGTRFLAPEVLARISSLELIARTVVEGFISGLHRSPYLGFSTDFAEHRQYMPGDDLRHLDWKLLARTDRLYIKKYQGIRTPEYTCSWIRVRRWDTGAAK